MLITTQVGLIFDKLFIHNNGFSRKHKGGVISTSKLIQALQTIEIIENRRIKEISAMQIMDDLLAVACVGIIALA
ncbi:hypothetical protein OAK83_02365 [bacterium]|nr:hypothetical protein [bacterium]